jgi:chemotaxis protein CheZ
LEEILTETAKAANDIMAAAERIEEIGATADPETAAALSDAVTRIYEASAFQDITGQRITKVVRALQHIETRIGALAEACEDSAMASGVVLPDSSDPMGDGIISDADLLNGPQLSKDANTQSEIDRLFGD